MLPFLINKFTFGSHSNGEAVPLSWMFWQKRRYIVVFMAFLGFFNVYSLRVNLSVGIVAMTEKRVVEYENGTIGYVSVPSKSYRKYFVTNCKFLMQFWMRQEQDFPWNTKERGLILSSFFWGYITTQFLGGLFGAKIGGNLVNIRNTIFKITCKFSQFMISLSLNDE